MRRAVVAVTLAAALALGAVTGAAVATHATGKDCPAPHAAGHAHGTMPSGTFVILQPTGDRYVCANGKVSVR
jgi:hypothetical protein